MCILFLPLLTLFGVKTFIERAMATTPSENGLTVVSRASRAGLSLIRLYSPVASDDLTVFFQSAEKKYLSKLMIYDLKKQVGLLISQGLNGSGDTQAILSSMESRANNLLKQLDSSDGQRGLISFGRELLPLAKWSMGFDRKRTFLLVLQNSMEQRPAGGLIEEVGVVVVEKGRLLDVSWAKPDDIDALLTGSEDSPQPIRAMLGETKLLFRDSNWGADGPTAALQLKRMYERATGRGIDGVVFISTAGLEDILEMSGKGSLKEKMAFSGSEYISQIANSLDDDLKTSSFSMIKGFLKGLENENIMMIPFNSAVARMASLQGVDGGIRQTPCPYQFNLPECSVNLLYVVDANLGANKADYFIRKSRRVSLTLDPENPPSTIVDLGYLNTSTIDNSSSDYRGYTRVVIPLESVVQSAVVIENGQSTQMPIDNFVELGRHIIGFSLNVHPGESKTIRITYVSTAKIPTDRGVGAYVVNVKKQLGDSVLTEVEIKFPNGITPISVYPQAKVSGNSLSFKLAMTKSDSVAVEFAINNLFR